MYGYKHSYKCIYATFSGVSKTAPGVSSLPGQKWLHTPPCGSESYDGPGEGQAGVQAKASLLEEPPTGHSLQTVLPSVSLTARSSSWKEEGPTGLPHSETFSEFVVCRVSPKLYRTLGPQVPGPRFFLTHHFYPLGSTVQ